jgi:hypothetical protein
MKRIFDYQKSFRNWWAVGIALFEVRYESDEVRLRRVALLHAADGHDVTCDTTHLKRNDRDRFQKNCCIGVFDGIFDMSFYYPWFQSYVFN